METIQIHFTPLNQYFSLEHLELSCDYVHPSNKWLMYMYLREKRKRLIRRMFFIAFLVMLSVCSFGQKKDITASSNGITITDDIRLQQLGLDRKLELSKGEALQQKDWEEFVKQFQSEEKFRAKYFHQRDSTHQVFLNYTVIPYLNLGDTVIDFKQSQKEFTWKLKPKKK